MSGHAPSSAVVPVPPSGQQAIICDYWPHRDALELGSLPGAVPCARLHARHILREWGLDHLAADAELLVSELMTNAVAASRSAGESTSVWLWLLADSMRVLILVRDASTDAPIPAGAGQDASNAHAMNGHDGDAGSGRGEDAASGPGEDAASGPGEDAESGRGLLLVAAISEQWDWYRTQHAQGKVVWALVRANSHNADGNSRLKP
jgi:hypothetical protein